MRVAGGISGHDSLEHALMLVAKQMARSRLQFRERHWAVPTADPRLDRFTLRGAVTLALEGYRSVTRKGGASAGTPVNPGLTTTPARTISDNDRPLRIE